MEVIELLRRQQTYSWNKETWFVPLAVAIEGLESEDAAWQPPGGGNTIWQIVNHLNYYNERLVLQINNPELIEERSISNTGTFGDKGRAEDRAGWMSAYETALRTADELKTALKDKTDDDLKEEYADGLAMVMMHQVYHTGQIVLIRKQQGSWPQNRE